MTAGSSPGPHPPPIGFPVVRHDEAALVYFVLPNGWQLTPDGMEKIAKLFTDQHQASDSGNLDYQSCAYGGWIWTAPANVGMVRDTIKRLVESHLEPTVGADDTFLPEADPAIICGVELDAYEVARFDLALLMNELWITNDMPIDSPVEEAWRRWCHEYGRQHRVRHEPAPEEWKQRGTKS